MTVAARATAAATLAALLALTGCASVGAGPDGVPAGAVESTRTEPNGDQVTEYRVDGRLRSLKVVPARGPTYYLHDRDGDGIVDGERDGVQPVYFKLFEWN